MKKIKFNLFSRPVVMAILVLAATLTGAAARLPDGAYIHLGDALVYASVLLLPLKYALPASVIGTVAVDLLLGSYAYAIPTIIIKTLTVLAVKVLLGLSKKTAVADLLVCFAGVVTVVGYFIADTVILLLNKYGLMFCIQTASDRAMDNIIQALACAALYMFISPVVRKIASKPRPELTKE